MKKHHRDEVSWGREGEGGSGSNLDELEGHAHITGDGKHEKASDTGKR